MNISRLISGTGMIEIGLFLIILSFCVKGAS